MHAKIWSLIGLQKRVKVNVLPFFHSFAVFFWIWYMERKYCFIKKNIFIKINFDMLLKEGIKSRVTFFSNFTLFRKLMHIKFRANLLKTVDLYKKRTNQQLFVNILIFYKKLILKQIYVRVFIIE